jgi:hypothetical protein
MPRASAFALAKICVEPDFAAGKDLAPVPPARTGRATRYGFPAAWMMLIFAPCPVFSREDSTLCCC